MLTALIVALVIGAIAGWLAGLLVQGTGFGLLGDIIVGVVGAMITSMLFPKLGIGLTLGGGIRLLGAVALELAEAGPSRGHGGSPSSCEPRNAIGKRRG